MTAISDPSKEHAHEHRTVPPWFAHYEDFVPRTVTLWDKPLYAMLDEAADTYPHRNALIFQNMRITYKKLRERAEIFAGALKRIGVEPGQRVAVMLPNLPQTMIAFWGAIKAGAVVVMTNPLYMEKNFLKICRIPAPSI